MLGSVKKQRLGWGRIRGQDERPAQNKVALATHYQGCTKYRGCVEFVNTKSSSFTIRVNSGFSRRFLPYLLMLPVYFSENRLFYPFHIFLYLDLVFFPNTPILNSFSIPHIIFLDISARIKSVFIFLWEYTCFAVTRKRQV